MCGDPETDHIIQMIALDKVNDDRLKSVTDMLTYLMQHDAHHRGQICTLARGVGYEFRGEDMTRLCGWRAIDGRATSRVRRSATKMQRPPT
jgi:DinB family